MSSLVFCSKFCYIHEKPDIYIIRKDLRIKSHHLCATACVSNTDVLYCFYSSHFYRCLDYASYLIISVSSSELTGRMNGRVITLLTPICFYLSDCVSTNLALRNLFFHCYAQV